MKKNRRVKNILPAFVIMFQACVLFSCRENKSTQSETVDNEYYTCSMDPQVIEHQPGNCPICHMKLIKVNKNQLKPGQIQLSAQQIKLANITFDTLHEESIEKEIILNGKVTFNQNLTSVISARVQGRIENITVKNAGDYVNKGQLLYEIYSEDLSTAQLEFLTAVAGTSAFNEFAVAARNKLVQYGMSEEQINRILTEKKIIQAVPVFANYDGYVTGVYVSEGNYVSTGTALFELSSMQSLWVEAQVYLPYLPYLKTGTEARFSIPAAGDKSFNGKVIFIDPQIQAPQRYVLARFEIPDPSQAIKPGMLAQIILQTGKIRAIAVPIGSIIRDSKGDYVWLRNSDGVFDIRMVKMGMQNSTQVEITEGLSEGDVVVITGAYLLNSEYIFKKGANPMAGHDHPMKKEDEDMKNMPGMNM